MCLSIDAADVEVARVEPTTGEDDAEAAEGGRCRRRVGVMGTTGKERGRRGREGGLGTATTATATATVATAASGGSERIRSVLLPALPLMRGDYFR